MSLLRVSLNGQLIRHRHVTPFNANGRFILNRDSTRLMRAAAALWTCRSTSIPRSPFTPFTVSPHSSISHEAQQRQQSFVIRHWQELFPHLSAPLYFAICAVFAYNNIPTSTDKFLSKLLYNSVNSCFPLCLYCYHFMVNKYDHNRLYLRS